MAADAADTADSANTPKGRGGSVSNGNGANTGQQNQGAANAKPNPPPAAGAAPAAPQGPNSKAKRRVRNYVLQPLLQVKIGIYCIILSVLFAGALAGIVWHNFSGLVNSILLLTDAQDDVRELFVDYWRGTQLWIYLCFCVYLAATVGISVLYTHKLVGPTIAFRRHARALAEGRYQARTYLRNGDAFGEVADELNHLSEVLERSRGGVPPASASRPPMPRDA